MNMLRNLITFIPLLFPCLAILTRVQGGYQRNSNGQAFLPSTQYCDEQEHRECQERAWIFPEIRLSLVCRYDFRKQLPDPNPFSWPDATSETIQATWGPFLQYLVSLVPQLGNEPDIVSTGLFWMQGGEGRPGWDIPPCGTNRTQGVVNLSYLIVLLNETTTDPDLYNAGLSYQTVNAYLDEESIRRGIEEYVCSDVERLYIGVADGVHAFDEKDFQFFYPQPEEICPRVSKDDSVWKDYGWWLLLLLILSLVVAVGMAVYYSQRCRNSQTAASNTRLPPLTGKESLKTKRETAPEMPAAVASKE